MVHLDVIPKICDRLKTIATLQKTRFPTENLVDFGWAMGSNADSNLAANHPD